MRQVGWHTEAFTLRLGRLLCGPQSRRGVNQMMKPVPAIPARLSDRQDNHLRAVLIMRQGKRALAESEQGRKKTEAQEEGKAAKEELERARVFTHRTGRLLCGLQRSRGVNQRLKLVLAILAKPSDRQDTILRAVLARRQGKMSAPAHAEGTQQSGGAP